MSKKRFIVKMESPGRSAAQVKALARGKKTDPVTLSVFEDIAKAWGSPVVVRDRVAEMTGGMISTGYLANLDCRGEGPPEKIRCGRKIAYPLRSFIPWLMNRAEPVDSREL